MAWKDKRSEEQKQADEKRKAGLRELSKKIAEMTDEAKRAFCKHLDSKMGGVPTCTGERVLSPFNSCFLYAQRSDVTVVGGFSQWKAQGRKVKKGAKAMAIWVRVQGKVESDVVADGENPASNPFFILRNCMFDISDTEPIESEILENTELAMPAQLPSYAMTIRPSQAVAIM